MYAQGGRNFEYLLSIIEFFPFGFTTASRWAPGNDSNPFSKFRPSMSFFDSLNFFFPSFILSGTTRQCPMYPLTHFSYPPTLLSRFSYLFYQFFGVLTDSVAIFFRLDHRFDDFLCFHFSLRFFFDCLPFLLIFSRFSFTSLPSSSSPLSLTRIQYFTKLD